MEQPPHPNDEDIALMMMEGDQEGLKELLRKYGRRAKSYLRKYFGDVLQEPEIQEALNVAAYNAWRFADRYDVSKGSLGSWFIRIAQRAAQSLVRAEVKHRHKDLEYDPAYDPAEPGDAEEECGPPDRKKERQLSDLANVIDRLPKLQRAIIEADLAAGDDGPADAARLAQLHATTKSSIYASRNHAKEKIRQEMLKLGHFQDTRASS